MGRLIAVLFLIFGGIVIFKPELLEEFSGGSTSGYSDGQPGPVGIGNNGGPTSTAASRPSTNVQPGSGSPSVGPPPEALQQQQRACNDAVSTIPDRGPLVRKVEEEMRYGNQETQKYWVDCLYEYDRRSGGGGF